MEFQTNGNFIKTTYFKKQIYLEDFKAFSPFGLEHYGGKKILNLSLSPKLLALIKDGENIINNCYTTTNPESTTKPFIRSSIKNKLFRVHVDSNTKFLDASHQCRTSANIKNKETYLLTIKYKGIWNYGERFGHYWVVTSLEFI